MKVIIKGYEDITKSITKSITEGITKSITKGYNERLWGENERELEQ